MIGIIDYGMGNLYSVQNALRNIGVSYRIVEKPDQLSECDKLILPGVGAFSDCMDNLKERGLDQALIQAVQTEKKPLLGICLGMQVLFESSTENGDRDGFGFLKGHIVKIDDPHVRIPHMGWNELIINHSHPCFKGCQEPIYVYFVHSYYATEMEDEDLIAYAQYGTCQIPGVVGKGNVLATQFHPEKSGEDGMKILRYFAEEFV